jgi:hypothetical protein
MDRVTLNDILQSLVESLPDVVEGPTAEGRFKGYCDALADVARLTGIWFHGHEAGKSGEAYGFGYDNHDRE